MRKVLMAFALVLCSSTAFAEVQDPNLAIAQVREVVGTSGETPATAHSVPVARLFGLGALLVSLGLHVSRRTA